ncbi:DUF3800 domain-containing protein [Myxococcus fulvus]|uniref:DUF3800 domain-containing protein n=1 Tax=Myxococcus fulvus TaxID=33 RepID=UPI0020BD510D|nr:DUF3800 domain-containing protein [Myxococcus fulvus]MCK8503233.1 DUF3800 domain-containing protein [Myxococcus fulvus]
MTESEKRTPLTEANVTAYTDESGNSGLNIFDNNQPWFWTATLLTESDLERDASQFRTLAENLGESEIHASELGSTRLNAIARSLRSTIVLHNCQFVFTAVEKRHVASMKLVDTLLDAGNNKAVHYFHYNARIFRLTLAVYLMSITSPQSQEEFWQVCRNGDEKRFKRVLERLSWNVRAKIHDRRVQEILGDAISYAREKPLDVLDMKRSALDSPNMVAFSTLIHGLHSLLSPEQKRIRRFVHDEQNQFGAHMQKMFDAFGGVKFTGTLTSVAPSMEKVDTYACSVEMSKIPLVGLQLVDVALWLAKRHFEGRVIDGECSGLLDEILRRSHSSEFSAKQLIIDANEGVREIFGRPFNEEDAKRATEFRDEMEAHRKAMMRAALDQE